MRRLLARRPLMPVAQSHLVRADWYAIPYVECTWRKRVPFRSATETNSYTFVRLPAAMRMPLIRGSLPRTDKRNFEEPNLGQVKEAFLRQIEKTKGPMPMANVAMTSGT